MKIKTSELIGPALDGAVAKCAGADADMQAALGRFYSKGGPFEPSTAWAHAGPIIEREKIELIPPRDEDGYDWMAVGFALGCAELDIQEGPTPLIAAMRCYVASKLGDEVDVPAELINA